MRIEQLMSRDVHHCRPEDTLDGAAYLMWQHDCGCVPVCSGNGESRVIGMLTDRDVCMAALFQGKPLRELRVADAMSREVRTCRPNDRPADVERVMREQQIRRIPVTEESGRLVGIVSLADLARVARQQDGSAAARQRSPLSEAAIGDTLAAICEPGQRTAGASSAASSRPIA
jgi:CBS domain-containing protein